MGRCKKYRRCRLLDNAVIFKPVAMPLKQIAVHDIEADEFEAIRLCDHEKMSQVSAGQVMHVSRGTVQRLLESGRFKLVNAILKNDGIRIKNSD